MKRTMMIVTACAAIGFAAVVWAQVPGGDFRQQMRERIGKRFGGGEMGGQGEMMQKAEMLKHIVGNPELAKKAGLSDEQIKKLKDSQFDFEKQLITLRAGAETAKLDVRRLLESDNADREALSKALDAAGEKELALRKAGILRLFDVKGILGKDTIEKIKKLGQEQMEQMEHHRMQQQPGPMNQDNTRPWLQRRGGQMPAPQPVPQQPRQPMPGNPAVPPTT